MKMSKKKSSPNLTMVTSVGIELYCFLLIKCIALKLEKSLNIDSFLRIENSEIRWLGHSM